MNALPIGLAARAKVNREIQAGDFITFDDVSLDETTPGYRLRTEMERANEILKLAESDIDVFDRL